MHRRALIVVLSLALATGLASPLAAQRAAPEYGPAKGTLVLVGGGSTQGTGIIERFIALGGGAENGRFVIIPTNGGNRNSDGTLRYYQDVSVLQFWKSFGLRHVTMLHTADPREADTEAFVKPLTEATAVWFSGGRQWNMVDSYKGARTEAEIHKLLDRGGVVGGTSAGATIQGDYLVRGDSAGPDVVMTKEANHQQGFALLRRTAVDQHIDTRNRWRDLQQVMTAFPGKYLGIGLAESTAIVVTGDRFEVMGKGKVAIHDPAYKGNPPWFTLDPGAVFDMKSRKVVTREGRLPP